MTEAEELELLELEEAEAKSAAAPKEQDPSMFSRIKSFASDPRSAMDIARANIAKAGQASPEQIAKEQASPITGTPPLAMPMAAAPALLQKAAGLMSNTASGRVVGGGVQGAMQGAIDNPGDRASGALKGGLIGGALGAGSEGIAKLLKGGGDVAMQAAVGRKKYTPGVGTTLADEGIAGTKGMMTRQVNKGLASRGAQMQDMAEEATKAGSSLNVGAEALEMGEQASKSVRVPGAPMASADLPKAGAINEFVDEMAMRGAETPVQALARRRAAGGRAYRGKEDPLQSLLGNLSKQEQAVYSKGLKEAIPEIAPVDKAYGALARAKSGLEAEPSLPKSLMGMISTGAHVLPGGSLGLSLGGQAATKAGQAAGSVNSPVARAALIDALMGDKKK